MIPAAFAPVGAHLWQSTIFAALAGLLTLAIRRNQARARFWLWLAASYKFLLPFSWLVSIGHQFEWHTAPAIVPPAFSVVVDAVNQPLFLTPLPAAKLTPNHVPVLLLVMWAVWFCGFVVVAAGWAREWLRIRAIVRAASPLPLDFPIRVVSIAARLEPGVVGIIRPVLLLPEGITARLTQAQLQAVLAHELCHVRRRDNLVAAVHMLIEALFWFHPLVWWLGARLIDERERACDEEVLQAGGQAQVYAESILKVCEFYLESPLTCVCGVTGSDLKKRIGRIMKEHLGIVLSTRKKLLLATAGAAALAVPLAVGVVRLQAQTAVADWQTAAGGKMAFDVASVKVNRSGVERRSSNITGFNAGPTFSPTGGLFSVTNYPLINYITFAYKLSNNQQFLFQMVGLPEWASINGEKFDVEARAAGNPSKDQYRLMVQSLLADRFKLAIHHETRQMPVLGLVLLKAGETGPQLQRHSSAQPCSDAPTPGHGLPRSTPPTPPSTPSSTSGLQLEPIPCGIALVVSPSTNGRVRLGARNVSMEQIGTSLGGDDAIDRPVVDRTGLSGSFDFTLEWSQQIHFPGPPPPDFQPDPDGPSLLTALQNQLGLTLISQSGPVDVIVIDHVEMPSLN